MDEKGVGWVSNIYESPGKKSDWLLEYVLYRNPKLSLYFIDIFLENIDTSKVKNRNFYHKWWH